MKLKYLPLLALLALPCRADQVASTEFKGLNNNENSTIIEPSYAQDLLNVDVTPGGKSVKKRSGYGLYKALSTSQPMRGGYHAFDSTGNDYQIWGSSKSLYGIVSDGTPLQLVSSATLNSTWDCTDSQGNSYCVNSNRDVYLKTDGTTKAWYTSPLGTMVEATPDRIAVAGVSGAPNTIYLSQANNFTNFVVGTNPTDAFTEVIASPGSKLTHIRWGCGKLLWWKDQSFGYFDFDDQFSAQVKTVSDSIGTFDNTSAIDPGGQVWFRGQDGHTWKYDCSVLTKETVDITPNIQVTGKRVSNSWTQTSQSDWQAGSIVPSGQLSTTISVGDVTVSSFARTENSSTQWGNGSANNFSIGASSLTLLINNSGNVENNSFDTAGFTAQLPSSWTVTSNSGPTPLRSTTLSWGAPCSGATTSPRSGSAALAMNFGSTTSNSRSISILKASDNSVLATTTLTSAKTCLSGWLSDTVSAPSYVGQRIKVRISATDGNGTNTATTGNSYVLGGPITFYYIKDADGASGTGAGYFDDITNGSSTITTGAFTSQIYDTGMSSATYQFQASYTANTPTPSFAVLTSSATNGVFTPAVTVANTNGPGARYVKWVSTITLSATDDALSSITSVTLIASSSGTFYSQVKNAPNLTGWSTFLVNQTLNDGTETYYIRASTNNFSILSSTPAWVAQSVGGLITASTGTYLQVRDDFAITAATQTPKLNDFTVNWTEGSSTDQAYMLYFDNAIWEGVAFGSGQSSNNYIFKRDLINDAWTQYNIGVGGMTVQGNRLYFGDPSTSNIYIYGSATSDNGTAINAYWRTKSFTGQDPFLQNQLTQIDTFAKRDQGSTLTSSYTLDASTTSTSYSINLSSSTNSVVQSRKLLPGGKLGYTFDLKYEDTSASSSWEIFGYRIGFIQLPYRSTP